MFIRCEKKPFILEGAPLHVGQVREVSPELLSQLQHLVKADWISIHQTDPEAAKKFRRENKSPQRTRTQQGHFVPDDPKTPSTNEAWKGGKAPTKVATMKKSELVEEAKKMGIVLAGNETKASLVEKIGRAGSK